MSWTRVFRRAGRRTNLALFAVLVGAFLTGWLSFAAGTPVPAWLATVSHGLFGLGVVALVPWKSVVVNRASARHLASWALLGLVALCLIAGFVQVFVGYRYILGVSPIQAHVGAALVAVPVFAWHVVRHRRRQGVRRRDLSRRALLRTGVFAAGTATAYVVLEGLGKVTGSPAASRVTTGSHRLSAADIPATIWLLDDIPVLDAVDHRVDVGGTFLSVADLEARGRPTRARLDCTSGWYADATWTGVPLRELLPAARLRECGSIEVASVTGYTRRFPPAMADALWLVTRCDGEPLSRGTGSPVRLLAGGRRGFWWVKWVASVRLTDSPSWLQPPFPLQ